MFHVQAKKNQLEKAKDELKGKVIFYEGWVSIVNADRYNNYISNSKMEKAVDREKALIPKRILDYMKEYDTRIYPSIYTPRNHKSEIINHK